MPTTEELLALLTGQAGGAGLANLAAGAPTTAAPASAAQSAQSAAPQQSALIDAYSKAVAAYQKRRGVNQSPLAARVGQQPVGGLGRFGRPGATQLQGGDLPGGIEGLRGSFTAQGGAHAGQTGMSYKLPNGKVAHEYFDPKGKRSVVVF